ncbi:unnamed protein product [Alopecurus aequalis]
MATDEPIRRRRGRPSAKSKIEQKPVLLESSCGNSSYSMGDKDCLFEPPTPTRKRGRPSRSKSSKNKMEQESLFVDRSSSSDEGNKEKYDDFDPEGLPAGFCKNNLPEDDVDIVLEDEEGKPYDTKYKAKKTGLSGRWKRFAVQHDLKVGDALVFQLVQPTHFKVYIIRENTFTATDGALGLLSLDTSMDKNTISKKEEEQRSKKDTKSKKVPRKKKKKVPEVVTRVISNKPSSDDSDNLASEEAAGGVRNRDLDIGDFVAVKSPMDHFKILVSDGSVIGHVVLPDRLRMIYYSLCHARKAFLHRHLPKEPSIELAVEMIVRTADIAEGIMAASTSSLHDLAMWRKNLESIKSMGMDVAFMIERIDDLIGLICAPSTMEETDRYKNLKLEQAGLARQMRDFELRLSILKDGVRKMDVEMKEMEEAGMKKKDQAVRKLAAAPW